MSTVQYNDKENWLHDNNTIIPNLYNRDRNSILSGSEIYTFKIRNLNNHARGFILYLSIGLLFYTIMIVILYNHDRNSIQSGSEVYTIMIVILYNHDRKSIH